MIINPNRSSCSRGSADSSSWPTAASRKALLAFSQGSRSLRRGILFLAAVLALGLPGVGLAEPEGAEDSRTAAPTELSAEDRAKLHRLLSGGRAYRARVQAAIMLGHRGTANEDFHVLRQALRYDSHYTVRGAAAMAIGNLGVLAGIEPLLMACGDHHAFVRRAARDAIDSLTKPADTEDAPAEDSEEFVSGADRAVPYLLLARERESPLARMAAVEALSRMESRQAKTALAEFLGDSDEGVRNAVRRSLTSWEHSDVVQVLAATLSRSPSFLVRAAAADIAKDYPGSVLIDALVDRLIAPLEEPRVQVAAHESLESMREHLEIDELIKRVRGVPDVDTRIRAILLLGIHGGDRAVDVLLDTLSDPNTRVRYFTVVALGQTEDSRAATALVRIQDHPDNARIRGAITRALDDISRAASDD